MVSFIGGGNRRKPPTCCKSPTHFLTCCCIEYTSPWTSFELTLYHTITTTVYKEEVSSWSWSYNSWIYNYLCNQCLLPLILWVRISPRRGVLAITLCDKVCQWLVTGSYFSPVTPVSSTSKTDPHNITEILLNATLNTISLTLYKDEPKTIDINNGRNHLTKMS